MLFSVVIATQNRPVLAARVLSDLAKQEIASEKFEVIIVDDGSQTQNVAELVRIVQETNLGDRIVLVKNAMNLGPAKARNLGVSRARGDWIAFTDDDVEIPSDWLRVAQDRIQRYSEIVGLEGKVSTEVKNPLYHSTWNEKGTNSKKYGGFLTANVFYRKSALEKVGGFDEHFPRAFREDAELAFRVMKIGRIPYCAALKVHHPARPISLGSAIRRELRYESDPLLNKKHPHAYPCLFAHTNLVWLALILLQFSGVLGFFIPWMVLNINVFWVASIAATLCFFILGGGILQGFYQWFGSYVRFYAFLKGSIKYRTFFSLIALSLKARRCRPVLTDAI